MAPVNDAKYGLTKAARAASSTNHPGEILAAFRDMADALISIHEAVYAATCGDVGERR